jgi:hypothetical protein
MFFVKGFSQTDAAKGSNMKPSTAPVTLLSLVASLAFANLACASLACAAGDDDQGQNTQGQNAWEHDQWHDRAHDPWHDRGHDQWQDHGHDRRVLSAPEIDPGQAVGALLLLSGTLAVIRGYRRKK